MYDFLSHLVFRRGHVHLEALPEGGVAVALGDGGAELGQDLEYYSYLKMFSLCGNLTVLAPVWPSS